MFYFRKSDAIFEIKKYEELICCIYLTVADTDERDINFSEEICEYIIRYLQEVITGDEKPFISITEETFKIYKELKTNISSELYGDNELKIKVYTNKLSLLTSMAFAKLMANMNPVDEVEKYKLKVSYIEEDIKIFDMLLSSYYIQGVVSGAIGEMEKCEKSSDVKPAWYEKGKLNRDNLERFHPHCKILLRLKAETAEKVHKYSRGNTYRPLEPSYINLIKVTCKI